MTESDNKLIIPFGVTVPCHRCKCVLKAGDVAYNDDKGRLYCPEHNPKRTAGPSATKQEMVRAQLNPIPHITDTEVQRRIQELEDAGNVTDVKIRHWFGSLRTPVPQK